MITPIFFIIGIVYFVSMVMMFSAAMLKNTSTNAQLILFMIGIIPFVNTAILLAALIAVFLEQLNK